MEDHDGLRHAERKLRDKNCDLIVLNSLDSLGARQTVVAFLEPGAEWSAPIQGTKQTVARHLLRWIERTSRGQKTRSKTSR
jgi:phosphopantothenoylcysteine synthetase/decarboxylase